MYLVDTSVWIDFLRGKENSRVQLLAELLELGEAALCEVVLAEICWGAENKKQYDKYLRYFSVLPFVRLPDNWPVKIAQMGYQLRHAGFRPFIADLTITLCAMENNLILLSSDTDFEPHRRLFGLRLK